MSGSRAGRADPVPVAARRRVGRLHDRLLAHYGAQGWWPARDPVEMMVGAVLVQNTSWGGVERAIGALESAGLLSLEALERAPEARLASRLRAAGTYRVKARRIKALVDFLVRHGGVDALRRWPTVALRDALLDVHGVGAETADAILVYAFERSAIVVDAYARRLLARLGVVAQDVADARLRRVLDAGLPADAALRGEFHALVVAHAKRHCRARPRCAGCPLARGCAHARDALRVR